jgi:hypothetical protein
MLDICDAARHRGGGKKREHDSKGGDQLDEDCHGDRGISNNGQLLRPTLDPGKQGDINILERIQAVSAATHQLSGLVRGEEGRRARARS